jgi:hypothetical protein
MVVYATDPVRLYDNLQKLEVYAEQQAGDAHPPLQFHNYVNGTPASRSRCRLFRQKLARRCTFGGFPKHT